jgi:uncharacterized protein (TIGR02145 family)
MKQIKILIYTFVISMLLDTTLSAVCISDVNMGTNTITSTAKDKYITNDTLVTKKYARIKLTGQQKTIKDIEGNIYKIGYFGHQVWMIENMRVTRYPGGDQISHSDWTDDDKTYSRGPKIDSNGTAELDREDAKDSVSVKETGLMYQWRAAVHNTATDKTQGICMDGWHIPSKQEWLDFFAVLGGDDYAGNGMKYTKFNAKMVGGHMYNDEAKWFDHTKSAFMWSSTNTKDDGTWRVKVTGVDAGIQLDQEDTKYGYSVRCIKNQD